MTAGSELSPGKLVDRRYRIQGILGRGGFGRTYLVADERRFGELCVLKEFVPNSQGDPVVAQKLRELFQREAAILHKLNHPQIPKFFAGFEEDNRLFIAQEYIDGKTYWRVLQERQRAGQGFSQVEIVRWLRDLLKVLNYLHRQNIVHRDISPDNIMLSKRRQLPVLIDFGVVKQAAPHMPKVNAPELEGLIQASVSVGKFGYAPNEQIRMGQCSPQGDLYALAVTAVVLLTGKPPNLLIDAKSLEWQWQKQVSLDPRLVKLLDKMMAEKPQDRYVSARAVLKDLHPLLQAPDLEGGVVKTIAQRVPIPTSQGADASCVAVANASMVPGVVGEVTPLAVPADLAIAGCQAASLESELFAISTQVGAAHAAMVTEEPLLLPTHIEAQIPPGITGISRLRFPNLPLAGADAAAITTSLRVHDAPRTNASAIQLRSSTTVLEKQPTLSLRRMLVLGVLALLPVFGAVVGVRSPHIASVCWALENCAEQQSEEQYQQILAQAASAKTLSENAQNLSDLQIARDRLVGSITQLGAFSNHKTMQAATQQMLLDYRNLLQSVEAHLEAETRAAQLLNRAEAEAQKAAEQTKTAKTVQNYQAAQLLWRKALSTLEAIPHQSFVKNEAVAKLQEYKARLEAINLRIASAAPATPASPSAAPATSASPSAAPAPAARRASASPTQRNQPQRSGSAQNTQQSKHKTSTSARSTPPNSRPNTVASRSTNALRARPSSSATVATPSTSPLQVSSQRIAGGVVFSANQTLENVSIWVENAQINADGNFVAYLGIANRSSRVFGFVPLFAEYQDATGQTVRSRVLFTGTGDAMLEPGEVFGGQVSLLEPGNTGIRHLTLVIQESTSGNRIFRIPF